MSEVKYSAPVIVIEELQQFARGAEAAALDLAKPDPQREYPEQVGYWRNTQL